MKFQKRRFSLAAFPAQPLPYPPQTESLIRVVLGSRLLCVSRYPKSVLNSRLKGMFGNFIYSYLSLDFPLFKYFQISNVIFSTHFSNCFQYFVTVCYSWLSRKTYFVIRVCLLCLGYGYGYGRQEKRIAIFPLIFQLFR